MGILKTIGSALRGLFIRPAYAATGAALLIATPFVAQWEGIRTTPYTDKIAGGLMTVCAGETRVEMREYTYDECMAMLEEALEENLVIVRQSVTVPTSPKIDAALISFIHNVGPDAFRRSTLLKRLNGGEYKTACNELLRWNRSNGRFVQGLANRRFSERQLCIEGISDVRT